MYAPYLPGNGAKTVEIKKIGECYSAKFFGVFCEVFLIFVRHNP